MRKLMLAYLVGVGSVLAYAFHSPSVALQLGAKLAAFQTTFAVDAVPIMAEDLRALSPLKPVVEQQKRASR